MTTSEKPGVSRRTFVRASAIGVAVAATGKALPAAAAQTTAAADAEALAEIPYVGAGSNTAVRPFWPHDIRIGSGLLQEKRDRMKAFLQSFDERRFLILFNNQAGRPNPRACRCPEAGRTVAC